MHVTDTTIISNRPKNGVDFGRNSKDFIKFLRVFGPRVYNIRVLKPKPKESDASKYPLHTKDSSIDLSDSKLHSLVCGEARNDLGVLESQVNKVTKQIAELFELNQKGYSIYFGVQPAKSKGFESTSVNYCEYLFAESDKGSKEEQRSRINELIEKLQLSPEQYLIIETKRSLHFYMRLPADALERHNVFKYKALMKGLQKPLTGDSVSNINRLMRVPGFAHTTEDLQTGDIDYVLCKFDHVSDDSITALYSCQLAALRKIVKADEHVEKVENSDRSVEFQVTANTPKVVKYLSYLLTEEASAIRDGAYKYLDCDDKSRSDQLIYLMKECAGCINYIYNFKIIDTLNYSAMLDVALEAVKKNDWHLDTDDKNSIDEDRLFRILGDTDLSECLPGYYYQLLDESKFTAPGKYLAYILTKIGDPEIFVGGWTRDRQLYIYQDSSITIPRLVIEQLYSRDYWISVNEKLYKWSDSHYELSETEYQRIGGFLSKVFVLTKSCKEHIKYRGEFKYDSPYFVRESYQHVVKSLEIESDKINPPSTINCTNGVLKLSFDDGVTYKLVPHDPATDFYLSEPNVEYNPQANDEYLNKLLLALPEPSVKILFRNIAAGVNLPYFRSKYSELLRALFLLGTGSNGKDTLRVAFQLLFGDMRFTGIPLGAFQMYDQNRAFGLSPLEFSNFNWPSESSHFASIDNCKSLFSVQTGDTIQIERKFADSKTISANTVLLFNFNELPSIKGDQFSLERRIAILEFPYTFKLQPDLSKNEIKAVPELRNSEFLRKNVLSALLNRLLEEMILLDREGIDYSVSSERLQQAKKDSNHLRRVVEDIGLKNNAENSYIKPGQLFHLIQVWYCFNNGLSNGRIIENDDKFDRLITRNKDVFDRLKAIFPNIENKRNYGIKGLSLPFELNDEFIKACIDTIDAFKNQSISDANPLLSLIPRSKLGNVTFDDYLILLKSIGEKTCSEFIESHVAAMIMS